MGENTKIEWADHTMNPWIGCSKISPACDGCYAEAMMDHRYGRVEWGKPGSGAGTRSRTSAGNWSKPKAWDRKAAKEGTRPFVFCASLADVFDNQVPVEWRRDLFKLIRETPNLVWLLLTKRPQLIVKLSESAGGLPPNAAIGATCEDQERAINLWHLACAARDVKPLFTFASFEPLLDQVDPRNIAVGADWFDALTGELTAGATGCVADELDPLDWAITGGESDQGAHKARPTHPDWFRSLREQAAAAGVPFHHKQNGEWQGYGAAAPTDAVGNLGLPCEPRDHHEFEDGEVVFRVGKARAGRLLDGVEHNARPEVRAA